MRELITHLNLSGRWTTYSAARSKFRDEKMLPTRTTFRALTSVKVDEEEDRRQGVSRDEDFGAYVAGRRPHLCRSAWLLCGDPHRAEDLVQEALTKLLGYSPATIELHARSSAANYATYIQARPDAASP